MNFNTPLFVFSFLGFLPVFVLFSKIRFLRNFLLLAAGLAFLMADSMMSAGVFMIAAAANYALIRAMARYPHISKWLLVCAILFNITNLLTFRIMQNHNGLSAYPLGLSFYTFVIIAYLIDVHRRRTRPLGPWSYLVGLSFFPALTSGPIMHLQYLNQEIEKSGPLKNAGAVLHALLLVSNGLFKKGISEFIAATALADIGVLEQFAPGRAAWIKTLCFAAMYYADFSGYSDIAIGLAKLMGINLPANFNSPYFATSIGSYWRRWHMTLGSWVRTYIFQPAVFSNALGFLKQFPVVGSALHSRRHYFGVLAAMFVMGVWHGITPNYAAWGFYMGLLLCLEMAFGNRWRGVPRFLQMALTQIFIMCGFTIFMGNSLLESGRMLYEMFNLNHLGANTFGFSYLVIAALGLSIPHGIDRLLIKTAYLAGSQWLAGGLVCIFFWLHYMLDGFSGATFVYSQF